MGFDPKNTPLQQLQDEIAVGMFLLLLLPPGYWLAKYCSCSSGHGYTETEIHGYPTQNQTGEEEEEEKDEKEDQEFSQEQSSARSKKLEHQLREVKAEATIALVAKDKEMDDALAAKENEMDDALRALRSELRRLESVNKLEKAKDSSASPPGDLS